MSAQPHGQFAWRLADLARAWRIGEAVGREDCTDGWRVSFLPERRIAVADHRLHPVADPAGLGGDQR